MRGGCIKVRDGLVYCEIGKMLKDDIGNVNPKLEVEGLGWDGTGGPGGNFQRATIVEKGEEEEGKEREMGTGELGVWRG